MATFGIAETLALGGALAAAQAGTQAYAAMEHNKQISIAADASKKAAQEEIAGQGRAADIQSERLNRDAARLRALVTVSAAERGVGTGGTVAALERNVDQDQRLNQSAINTNRYGQERRTLAGLVAHNASLEASSSNIFLSGLQGGLQGFETGLAIGGGIDSLVNRDIGGGRSINRLSGALTVQDGDFISELKQVPGFS